MVFIDDLKDKISGELHGGKIILFDGGFYIEGHGGIESVAEDSVSFRLKKKRLVVEGRDMKLTCISRDGASVKGRVSSIKFE